MSRHPIACQWPDRWQFHPDFVAYMSPDLNGGRPNVTIEHVESATDASIVVPAGSLVALARGLLAAHVEGSRPEWRGTL